MSESRSAAFVETSVPEAYDRFMAVQLFEPWARELVRRAGPVRGVSALDVASGSGVVARLVAVEVGGQGRVVASDISAAMLAVAATKPVEPGSARIEYLACSASALDVADESVQLVLCQHGLQFFADGAGALREMYRVLEPGGVAVVSTWPRSARSGSSGRCATRCARLESTLLMRARSTPTAIALASRSSTN